MIFLKLFKLVLFIQFGRDEIVVINQYNSMILANITGTNNNNNICYEIINTIFLSYNYNYYLQFYLFFRYEQNYLFQIK